MNPIVIEQKYKSRKFIIAILLTLCTTLLALASVLDGTNVTIIFGIVGSGYGLTNIFDKKIASNNSQQVE
jgi:hypothetical protein